MDSSNYSITRWIKKIIVALILFLIAPYYFFLWIIWRLITFLMPNWLYQIGDDFVYGFYQRIILFYLEYCVNIKMYFYGDAAEIFTRKEKVIYMSNHQSSTPGAVDWMVANILAERQGSLNNVRFVIKDSIRLLPLYGFYFDQ
ncbi:hypothetical protein LAZ67_14002736, partial [Cordylochernes scorpioides]